DDMPEILDDSAKRSIRLAVETGWLLAEAYAGARTGGEASRSGTAQGPDLDRHSASLEEASCPETLTEALHWRSTAGSAPLLRAGATAQELADLLHLDGDAKISSCEDGNPRVVLNYTGQLDSLLASADFRTREAFRLGVSLGELMTASPDRLRDRFSQIEEP